MLCTLPFSSCYSNLHNSYHTSSSAYLDVPCLWPSISVSHTRSFTHLGVSCLRPSMPTSQPTLPLSSSSYCGTFYPPLLLLLASCKSARVSWSCFSDASWLHQASLMCPPPLYHVSLVHTSNKGLSATHWDKVFKLVKQLNTIGAMEMFTKPNCNICMEERLTILKKLCDKYVMVMNNNSEIYGACRHKTTFRRFCLSTYDPVLTGETVRPLNGF